MLRFAVLAFLGFAAADFTIPSEGGDQCSSSEYCCPDAKHCLTPTNVSCVKDPNACSADQTCCPLTKICVSVGKPCESPCKESDTYCCPDAKACLKPTNPGEFCKDASDCGSSEVCCPLTKLCVKAFEKCEPGASSDLAVSKVPVAQLGNMLGHGMPMDHSFGGNHSGFGGDALQRTFTKYNPLPVGADALDEAMWTKSEECDPHMGYMWKQPGYSKDTPILLFTTKGGQPSGVAVDIYGAPPDEQLKYAQHISGNQYRISVAFRQGDILCSGEKQEGIAIGDKITVNPGGVAQKQIPLTEDEAASEGWVRGSCFDGMGFHRFFDTGDHVGPGGGPGYMTWQAKNLFPVVAMYHEGAVNAIFFASWYTQQSFTGSHQWEPIPLINSAMCKNWCDDECTFAGTKQWSTMHIYFRDHKEVTCPAYLKCFVKGVACCNWGKDDAVLIV